MLRARVAAAPNRSMTAFFAHTGGLTRRAAPRPWIAVRATALRAFSPNEVRGAGAASARRRRAGTRQRAHGEEGAGISPASKGGEDRGSGGQRRRRRRATGREVLSGRWKVHSGSRSRSRSRGAARLRRLRAGRGRTAYSKARRTGEPVRTAHRRSGRFRRRRPGLPPCQASTGRCPPPGSRRASCPIRSKRARRCRPWVGGQAKLPGPPCQPLRTCLRQASWACG